jgi:hypothetical protein
MKDLIIEASWAGFNKTKKDDVRDKKAIEQCVLAYIKRFNSLPPDGLMIDGGTCDPAEIDFITFSIEKVFVYLKFN